MNRRYNDRHEESRDYRRSREAEDYCRVPASDRDFDIGRDQDQTINYGNGGLDSSSRRYGGQYAHQGDERYAQGYDSYGQQGAGLRTSGSGTFGGDQGGYYQYDNQPGAYPRQQGGWNASQSYGNQTMQGDSGFRDYGSQQQYAGPQGTYDNQPQYGRDQFSDQRYGERPDGPQGQHHKQDKGFVGKAKKIVEDIL